MRMLVLTAWLMILAACAHTYVKEGASQHEFDKAKTDCQVKLHQAGIDGQGADSQQNFMDQCMSGEGWTLRQ